MTDYAQQFAEEELALRADQGPSGQAFAAMEQEQADTKDAEVESSARTAYDATNLGGNGPPEGSYDYKGDYEDGNTFKADEDGGVTLHNRRFNPGQATVAGYDLATGKKYADRWLDPNGKIAEGMTELSDGQFSTLTGATYDQTDSLFKVANGMYQQGATYQDFQDELKGPWNQRQTEMAWTASVEAHDIMYDIDSRGGANYDLMRDQHANVGDMGNALYDEIREVYSQYEGVVATIPAGGYTEESLSLDKDWIEGNRKLAELLYGPEASEGASDEDIAESGKFFISQTRNNIDMTMLWANRIITSGDAELARTWLALDAQYDAMDMSMESVGRFAMAQMNVTNLLTFGGGVLITNLGKFATQEGIKNSLKMVAYGSAFDAAATGAMAAGENVARQKVEITGEQRQEVDKTEAAVAGGVGTLMGFGVGGGINVAANKTVRDYALSKGVNSLKFMGQNMKDLGVGAMPGSLASQRGSVGIPVTGDQQVMASFKLQDALGGIKDGSKPITVRENVRALVNKGLITEQEVKWSGIEDFVAKKEAAGQKVGRQELIDHVEQTTPKPRMVLADDDQYSDYSLLAKGEAGEGYKERMIVLPGMNPRGSYSPVHFGEAAYQLDSDDAMIGHTRIEGAFIDSTSYRGKMVLEIQSDFHAMGQRSGYIDKDGAFVGTKPIQKEKAPAGSRADLISYQLADVQKELLDLAALHDIDPHVKNSTALLWPHMSEDLKSRFAGKMPDVAPFGKDWDSLGMRLEIMDSINNGDKFVAWPSDMAQVSTIEQWGAAYSADGAANITKRSTVDRAKAMEKMGLKVEKVDMPQYEDANLVNYDFDTEMVADEIHDVLRHQNMMLHSSPDSDDWILMSYPEGIPQGLTNEALEQAGEVLETIDSGDYWDWATEIVKDAVTEQVKMPTTFNVIRLTDEVKAKFRKDGMNMYSAAPVGAAAIGATKPEDKPARKRDSDGRFSK